MRHFTEDFADSWTYTPPTKRFEKKDNFRVSPSSGRYPSADGAMCWAHL